MDILNGVQQRVTKMLKDLKHVSYVERVREPGLFSVEKAQEDLLHMYKYLMGGSKKGGPRFFQVMPSDRPQGNRKKLKWRKFQFPHFTVSMVEHRNRLPGEVVESLSLKVF